MADTKISALSTVTSISDGDYIIVNVSDGSTGYDTKTISYDNLKGALDDDYVTVGPDNDTSHQEIKGKKIFKRTVRIKANAGTNVPAGLTIGDDANNGGYGLQVAKTRNSAGDIVLSDPGTVFRIVSLDITSPIAVNNVGLIDVNKPYLNMGPGDFGISGLNSADSNKFRTISRLRVGPDISEVDFYSQIRVVSVNKDVDTRGGYDYGGTANEPAISWGWIPLGTSTNASDLGTNTHADLDTDEGYGWGVAAETASGFNRGGTKFTFNFLKNYHKKFDSVTGGNERQNGKTLISIVPPNDGGVVDGADGAEYTLSWSKDLLRVQSSAFTTRSSSTHTITDVNVNDFGSKLDSITPVLATSNNSLRESLDFIGSELAGVDSKFAIESVDDEGNVSYGINYNAITIGLIAALKSEKAKRIALETQVADLLARVSVLEG